MKIEAIIRDAFEKEMERLGTCVPPFNGTIPGGEGKNKKERYGFCILCIAAAAALSLFLLKAGVPRSPLVITWNDIITLMPENLVDVFLNGVVR
jgi:hypothetical protein